jgi:hypothetical protein
MKQDEGRKGMSPTPGRAIRKYCIDCVGSVSEIRDCRGDKLFDGPCLFYPYRMGKGRPAVRLIRKHCLWCMGGSEKLVRDCPSRACPSLPFRMGKSLSRKARGKPFISREGYPVARFVTQDSKITESPEDFIVAVGGWRKSSQKEKMTTLFHQYE